MTVCMNSERNMKKRNENKSPWGLRAGKTMTPAIKECLEDASIKRGDRNAL